MPLGLAFAIHAAEGEGRRGDSLSWQPALSWAPTQAGRTAAGKTSFLWMQSQMAFDVSAGMILSLTNGLHYY